MQELGKFNLKLNVIPNELEKCMSFSINNKLSFIGFIDTFQFLSSSLDGLAKNLSKGDFKFLSQEFDNNVLDILKQKCFYSDEYVSDFERFKEELSSTGKFYSLLTGKKLVAKNMNMFLRFRTNLE